MSGGAKYRVSAHGSTFMVDGDWARFVGHSSSPWDRNARTATAQERAAYRAAAREYAAAAKARHDKEAELLDLCGLIHDDFCRFRSVSLEDGKLFICTRENGIGGRSVDAIKNDNYESSETDMGDTTYEHYTFSVPA